MDRERPTPEPQASVQIHYIKASGYHEIPCHGAIGGLTPQNQLWMGLFSERLPLPRTVVMPAIPSPDDPTQLFVDENGTKPLAVDSRAGVIRNVEISTYLDLAAAERLLSWLQTRVAELKNRTGQQ